MRRLRQWVELGTVVVSLTVLNLAAQTTTNSPTAWEPDRTGQVIVPGGTPVLSVDGITSVARPDRPERMSLPQDIRDRVQSFEKVREAYLAEQRELARRLRGASDDDRQRIRDLIRERREAWLEEAKKFREEARKRLEELKRELPRYQEALDAARERATDAVKEARKRRGSD